MGTTTGVIAGAGRRRGDPELGAAAVEFGLLLPLLMLIIFGIIQFGMAFNAQIALTQAAREGVRALAINPGASSVSDADARTRAAAIPLAGGAISITDQSCPSPASSTAKAKVTATYNYDVSVNPAYSAYQTLMGMFGPRPANTITLTGIGEMRCLG